MAICNLVWLLALHTAPTGHDFHLSRCDIVYRPATSALEITQHIFVDDLELALEGGIQEGHLNLCTEQEHEMGDVLVKEYMEQHLRIVLDGERVALSYLGKEAAEDPMAIWVYVEAANVPVFENADITYDLLFEVYDDQKNIVAFKTAGDSQKMFLLDHENPMASVAR